jgi:hypothetical protein
MVLAIGILLDVFTPGSSTDYTPRAYTLAMSVQYLGWVAGGIQVFRYRRRARAHLADSQPEAYQWMTRNRRDQPR